MFRGGDVSQREGGHGTPTRVDVMYGVKGKVSQEMLIVCDHDFMALVSSPHNPHPRHTHTPQCQGTIRSPSFDDLRFPLTAYAKGALSI